MGWKIRRVAEWVAVGGREGWRAEMGRVRGRVKPSAHVAKARVSPASHGISGMHPYADPHWYDNIYILHIRSGPYTRSPIPHCWLSATSAFDWHYWSRRWHQITFLFAYIRGPVWSRANLPSYLSHGSVCVCVFFFFFFLPSATSHIAGATISAWCFRARNEHDRRMTASRLPCPASCKNQDCLEI